jgi:hypothetical protein
MNDLDPVVTPSGRATGQRRLWFGILVVGLLGLALGAWWLLGPQGTSEEERVRSEGYVAVGTQDGDTFWAKKTSPEEVSIVSTGRDEALCNGAGPDVVGTTLCSSGVDGQAYIIVMVAPTNTAQVSLETSVGSRTLRSADHVSGMQHVITIGVFRGEQATPVVIKVTYLSASGAVLVG